MSDSGLDRFRDRTLAEARAGKKREPVVMLAAPVPNAPIAQIPCDVEPHEEHWRELLPPHPPIRRGRPLTFTGFLIVCAVVVIAVGMGTFFYG